MKYPTISVITPTYNSSKTIELCLESIRNQNYPQDKIEIIIIDGGSKDKTLEIVKKFKVKIIKTDPKKQNVEYNKSTGIKHAKNELLFMIDHDNILQSKSLINKMVQPLINDREIVGVETLRYTYDSKFTLLDRYFALFAVTDPLAFYLGKADRLSYLYDKYYQKYKSVDKGEYIQVKFTKDIPTIGANGFLVRRKLLVENAMVDIHNYFPIDVNVDLIKNGFNKYAFIKDSITHLAGHGNVLYYLKRRMLFVKQYYFKNIEQTGTRRYSVFERKDLARLIFFILISTTFIIPTIHSIKGFIRIHDLAWFVHPFMCFGFVIIYGYVILENQKKKHIR